MCGRFGLFCSPRVLKEEFNLGEKAEFARKYNIPPGEKIPVIGENPSRGERSAAQLKWGLKPPWQENEDGDRIINARAESLFEKPVFKKIASRQRCIIPASGFYEWKDEEGNKQPYWFYPEEKELLAFAGLWRKRSCVIITRPATPAVRPLHERMPALLATDNYDAWLDPAACGRQQLENVLSAGSGRKIKSHRVDQKVNNPEYETRNCVEPVD